jgi:hypothetical protein
MPNENAGEAMCGTPYFNVQSILSLCHITLIPVCVWSLCPKVGEHGCSPYKYNNKLTVLSQWLYSQVIEDLERQRTAKASGMKHNYDCILGRHSN